MRIIGAIIAIIPLLTTIKIFNKRELLNPSNLFSLLYIITILIPTVIYAGGVTPALLSNAYLRDAVSDDSVFLLYCVLQTVSYYLVLFGIGVRLEESTLIYIQPSAYSNEECSYSYSFDENVNYRLWGIVFTVAGFLAFLIMMQRVGGIYYFFTHLQYRSSLTRDLDLLSWLLSLLRYGPLILVYSLRGTGKGMSIWLLLLIVISGFCYGMGGRKAVILMLFEATTIYHYTVKPITVRDVFKLKYIILAFVIVLFFVTYVQFRIEGAFERFLIDPFSFISENNKGLAKVFASESYVSFYMAIIKYFKDHSLWMGASYLGMLTAIIPSSLYAAKPPVDDGMYLYSICQGRTDIFPVMRTSALNGSSYPLETFGSTYANFGVFGVFIGMFLLGVVISFFYRKMQKSGYSIFSIIVYSQVVFEFQFSTLRMFQLFQVIVIVWMMLKLTQIIRLQLCKK